MQSCRKTLEYKIKFTSASSNY